jgi:hypothetical protein
MPKIKYDVRDVESSGGFETPPPGLYKATLAECNLQESKKGNEMLECIYELAGGDYKGSRVWDYVVLNEASEWKLRQFLEAVGKVAGKRGAKGSFDPDEFEDAEVQVRLKHETYNDEPRARVAAVLPLPEDDEEGDEEEVDAEETEDEEGEGEAYTYEDLEGMDLDELKEVIAEEELEIRVTKKSKAEKVLEKVAEALELEPPEDEDEEESDDEDEDDEGSYEEMTPAELKQECKDRGLKAAGKKAVLIARLEKDDEEAEDPFE